MGWPKGGSGVGVTTIRASLVPFGGMLWFSWSISMTVQSGFRRRKLTSKFL